MVVLSHSRLGMSVRHVPQPPLSQNRFSRWVLCCGTFRSPEICTARMQCSREPVFYVRRCSPSYRDDDIPEAKTTRPCFSITNLSTECLITASCHASLVPEDPGFTMSLFCITPLDPSNVIENKARIAGRAYRSTVDPMKLPLSP